MSRQAAGNIVATILALAVAAATIYLSMTRLKMPQGSLDWASLIFSGLTTGIITFFITWGHFQKDPTPPDPAP